MAIRTGKVIMAKNIHLDKSYKNVLSYSDAQMVTLLTNNAVQVFNNCSFLRPGENAIKLEMSYNNALRCNYLGFQNPDYSNKWFFAFIDEVEYVSDKTVIVKYTIDEFQTWYDYWQPEPCFVEREHTNDDTIGKNLVPEQLEMGDYVKNGTRTLCTFGVSSLYYCIISIYTPKNETVLATNVCGIPISGGLYIFSSWQAMQNAVQKYSDYQKLDYITQVFAIPAGLAGLMTDDSTYKTWGQGTDEDSFWQFNGKSSPYSVSTTLNAPSTLDGYTPANAKMFTYPFICCALANTAGTSNILAYEYFTNRQVTTISYGVPTVGGSIMVYPQNYKNHTNNLLEGVSNGKFPTLSWSGDDYTNWLTQNAVNIGLGVAGDMILMGVGGAMAVTGNPMGLAGVAGGFTGIFHQAKEVYQHHKVPYSSVGNVNIGDVVTASGVNGCYLYPMSIRYDQAQRIDKFLTRFGYQTNLVKLPNQVGRRYWNFVKIGTGEDIGHSTSNDYFSVPASSMETINQIYRTGVTIWHDHANIGDFTLANTIV